MEACGHLQDTQPTARVIAKAVRIVSSTSRIGRDSGRSALFQRISGGRPDVKQTIRKDKWVERRRMKDTVQAFFLSEWGGRSCFLGHGWKCRRNLKTSGTLPVVIGRELLVWIRQWLRHGYVRTKIKCVSKMGLVSPHPKDFVYRPTFKEVENEK